MGTVKVLKPEFMSAYKDRFGDATLITNYLMPVETPDEWWMDFSLDAPSCPSCAALRAEVERLRKESKQFDALAAHYSNVRDIQTAEIDRLKGKEE